MATILTSSLRAFRASSSAWILVIGILLAAPKAQACPFCSAPTTTFSEQFATAQEFVFAQWKSAQQQDVKSFGTASTTFQVLANGKSDSPLAPGQLLNVPVYLESTPGTTFLLLGSQSGDQMAWSLPQQITRECWDYILQAPARSAANRVRLQYSIQYLEHSDPDVAADAYGEFAGFSFAEVRQVADALPRKSLHDWLTDPQTVPTRRGLYGMLLGLCGNANDTALLERLSFETSETPQLGLDGIMAGYLLLSGSAGLDHLKTRILNNPSATPAQLFAVIQAVRFLWTDAPECVPANELRSAMRQLLDDPLMAEQAVIDLARWQDWEIMDDLIQRYGQGIYADRYLRRAVVRYLVSARESSAEAPVVASQSPVTRSKQHLETLRQVDPETVNYVEAHPFD